jgi:hypothetical protein
MSRPRQWSSGPCSYVEATEAIERRHKQKIVSERINLGLPVLLGDGVTRTKIKGMHAREGTLLFEDGKLSKDARSAGYDGGYLRTVYPDVLWLGDALKNIKRLAGELREAQKKVKPYGIEVSYSPWGVSDESIEKLKAEYAEKKQKAESAGSQE